MSKNTHTHIQIYILQPLPFLAIQTPLEICYSTSTVWDFSGSVCTTSLEVYHSFTSLVDSTFIIRLGHLWASNSLNRRDVFFQFRGCFHSFFSLFLISLFVMFKFWYLTAPSQKVRLYRIDLFSVSSGHFPCFRAVICTMLSYSGSNVYALRPQREIH